MMNGLMIKMSANELLFLISVPFILGYFIGLLVATLKNSLEIKTLTNIIKGILYKKHIGFIQLTWFDIDNSRYSQLNIKRHGSKSVPDCIDISVIDEKNILESGEINESNRFIK